jgi:ribosomal-protein-alanine N-acetyltransferase
VRLETKRLVVRSFDENDATALFAILVDPEVRCFLPPSPVATVEQFKERIAARIAMESDRGYAMWAVALKNTGELIGQCGLQLVERTGPEIEIAYHYAPSSWNKGFGTEAAVAVLDHGFQSLDLECIVAFAHPDNAGSWRIMEKAGMR